ncbi:MAG: hypothetical protein QOE36_2289, partial [Gaiellaceae bacterium]|nr:hypothetical protein [Gaiellaceae bacterium]
DNARAAPGAIDVIANDAPHFAGLESAVTCLAGPAGGGRSSAYTLGWTAASDDGTPAARIVYDVYTATSSGKEDYSAPTYTSDPGATSFRTPPLASDTTYYFVVRARDTEGRRDRNRVERAGENICD